MVDVSFPKEEESLTLVVDGGGVVGLLVIE